MTNIVVVDYGLGNIRSVAKSLEYLIKETKKSSKACIINNVQDLKEATHIILPGQGAFEACMTGLKNIPGMIDELSEKVLIKSTPFLGICVGMQLLANTSYENGEHKGLGWINGKIKKIPQKNLKLPHIGWNEVSINKNNDLIKKENFWNFYFVHSYYFDCEFQENEIGKTHYSIDFTSFVSKGNIFGVQFHPEKSSSNGLSLLKNFICL